VTVTTLRFELTHDLEATRPPDDRGSVRLLVAGPEGVEHARFADLPRFLRPGDLIVINTSAPLPAAVDGTRTTGERVAVHFAAALDDGDWVVEVRPACNATGPVTDLIAGERIEMPDGVVLVIGTPHPRDQHRLWHAGLAVDGGVVAYLGRHGRPIRYDYVPSAYPLAEYHTVFAREPGSAEMPSAGRPFTNELVTELITHGVVVAPIMLHTGVSSPETGEPPQPERFRVPEPTARLANLTRAWGNRVVAVGTTVTRALEAAADDKGVVEERAGWTDLVLGPQRPARVVGGLLTGWHAPGASHLDLLQAVAGAPLVDRAYRAALRRRYLWHEFGDSCLLLP
jgi:S-adenosylmethionine:tRNA ribosyltransferase-isomerase